MKTENLIINAFKRTKSRRGLRLLSPNNYLSEGHIKKADHNLIVMTDLNELGHEDWTVITAYYAMYQSALALLAKTGMESKEHATTAAVLEYFFGDQLSKELIEKFNEVKNKIDAITINEKYIDYLWKAKMAREKVQYGISIDCRESSDIMQNARDFVSKIKLVISELNDELVETITNKTNELKEKSEAS